MTVSVQKITIYQYYDNAVTVTAIYCDELCDIAHHCLPAAAEASHIYLPIHIT